MSNHILKLSLDDIETINGAKKVLDSSGTGDNVHNGTISGATLVADDTFGSCFNFNGVDDYVEIPHRADLSFGLNEDFTLMLWIKASAQVIDPGCVIGKGNAAVIPYELDYDGSTGRLTAIRQSVSGSPVSLESATAINDGQFHHAALVKEGTRLSLYIDGTKETSQDDLAAGALMDEVDKPKL